MNPTVIVIDDSNDVVDTINEMLKISSIDVLATGCNGKEAAELYQKHLPDFVILDHSMPDFDGLYGLEKILKINSDAKVILLTGSVDEGLHEKLKQSGSFVVMQKPCSMNDLTNMIFQNLRLQHSLRNESKL